MSGTDPTTYARERPGISAFALQGGVVYYANSAYGMNHFKSSDFRSSQNFSAASE